MNRPASPTEKAWARPRISIRQPMTARPVKPAGPSGQPTGQNGPAHGPYKLMNKKKTRAV